MSKNKKKAGRLDEMEANALDAGGEGVARTRSAVRKK
jgi:hypothetical protein